jgi:hypothetical protein
MSFEPEFLEMMVNTVTVEHWDGVSQDQSGEPSNFSAPVSYRCRIAGKAVALRRPDNTQEAIIFDCWLYNHDAAQFRQADRITIPPSFQFMPGRPSIFTVGSFGDTDTQHHVKLQFGWQYHRQGQ